MTRTHRPLRLPDVAPADSIDVPASVPMPGVVRVLVSAYGPLAFGMVSLIVLWLVIVRPELTANREERKAFTEGAKAIERSVGALDGIVDRIERLEAKR